MILQNRRVGPGLGIRPIISDQKTRSTRVITNQRVYSPTRCSFHGSLPSYFTLTFAFFRVIMARSLSEHFDSITSDSIDPLLSDCCFSIPPSSVPESQSTAPITTEPPPILERVGPKRNYILWTAMNKAIFIQWWLTTTYGQKPRAEHPRWDKRGLISEVWTHFEQGAEISTGRPCITCKDCGQIYAHSPKNGTNIMTRHRERCLPKGKLNQRNIQAAIRTQVRQR